MSSHSVAALPLILDMLGLSVTQLPCESRGWWRVGVGVPWRLVGEGMGVVSIASAKQTASLFQKPQTVGSQGISGRRQSIQQGTRSCQS